MPDTSDPSATVFINSMVHSVCEITILNNDVNKELGAVLYFNFGVHSLPMNFNWHLMHVNLHLFRVRSIKPITHIFVYIFSCLVK